MVKRIFYFAATGIFWLLFFISMKLFFLLFNFRLAEYASIKEILQVFQYGFSMDLSATAYLMVLPGILILLTILFNARVFLVIIRIYTILMLIGIVLLVVGDAELYQFWGYRMDVTPLLYLKTPKEAFASVSGWVIMGQLIFAIGIFGVFIFIFRKLQNYFGKFEKINPLWALVFLPLILLLFIPIRGGVGIAPMNTSRAYFSSNNFLNHAGINLFWNIGFSLTERKTDFKEYEFFGPQKEDSLVSGLLNHNLSPDSMVLSTQKPNVILIILESFSAKVIGSLGGEPEVTPNINALSKEGLLFTNFYASGDRSDKGLIAILCGYPAQPITSVIVYSHKTESLPKLSEDLKKDGYKTSYYYGGDLNFANMRSFLVESQFDEIVSMQDFPKSTYNSKWGANDHVVFNRFFNDVNASKTPFFKAFFTLSSHEPFEVPRTVIPGSDRASKLMNAQHYTDSCVGSFVQKARLQPWWKNTLIILVADHGHPDPGNSPNHVPAKFRIPMLWLGGALKTHGRITKFASQIDIPSTLLHQLGKTSGKYRFSKDIFAKEPGFAYYSFNNGFGFMSDSATAVYDCGFKNVIISDGNHAPENLNFGKAYLQFLYQDFKSRK